MRLKGGGRACHIIFLTKTRGSRHVQGLPRTFAQLRAMRRLLESAIR